MTNYRLLLVISILIMAPACSNTHKGYDMPDIDAPYKKASGTFSGERVPHSPDPLVAFRWEDTQWDDSLQVYTLTPVSVKIDDPQCVQIKSNTHMTVQGPCDLMFDFGVVSAAWFEFEAEDIDGDIEMSISEFNEPAVFNVGSQHPVKTAKPVKYGNTYRLELNEELYEGVRFAWIHFKELNKPLTISAVRLVCQIKPTNYEGSFACSDTTLTRIWYTGAYTVKLNLLQDHFGAILMERSDRHSWTGDAHTSQAASMVAFGNYDFVKTNILYTSTQSNGIASYSLYWVLSLIDYYNYTGDRQLVEELLENARNKLDIAYQHYGKNPPIAFCGWDERLGAGFESPNEEAQQLYKMLSIRTWNEFGDMMLQMGYPELAATYKRYVLEKLEALREDPNWTSHLGVHSVADAVNTGFTNDREQRELWEIAFADRQRRLSYSPFNQYFIMQALARMERFPEALNTVRDCWGGQLDYGATTFFEVFRPSWNDVSSPNDAPINNQCGYTSLTHPWSAGVTKWLTEEILGIKPTAPGFTCCMIKPRLSDRVTWVRGSVPTLRGKIKVFFDGITGQCEVEVPQGVEAIVGIPKSGREIKNIRFGKSSWQSIEEDADFLYFCLLEGSYTAKVEYVGEFMQTPTEEFFYTVQITPSEDRQTQGNWRGKYGTKGFALYNYEGPGQYYQKLPDFVEEFRIGRSGDQHWAQRVPDIRALESPVAGAEQRSIGAVITRDPLVCQQTITVDIKTAEKQEYNVSLYFVDWDKQDRRTAIEAFDLESKEMILPVYMVRDYEEGKYVTYTFSQPVRLRINHVRGRNAALSGIFFD